MLDAHCVGNYCLALSHHHVLQEELETKMMTSRLLLTTFPWLRQFARALLDQKSLQIRPTLKRQFTQKEVINAIEDINDLFMFVVKQESTTYQPTEEDLEALRASVGHLDGASLFGLSTISKNPSFRTELVALARKKGWKPFTIKEKETPACIEDWVVDIQLIVAREGKNSLDFIDYAQSPKFVRLKFAPATIGTRVKTISHYDEDFMIRLNVKLPIITTHPGHLAIDITLPEDQWTIPLLKDYCDKPKDGHIEIPVGIGVDGKLISVPVTDERYCHWLVGATTGGGKSVWLTQAVASLSRYNPAQYRLTVIDFKVAGQSPDFGWLSQSPINARVITNKPEALTFLEKTVSNTYPEKMTICAEARRASVAIYNESNDDEPLPWDIVIIDEYADLMILEEGDEEDQKAYKAEAARINSLVTSIAAKGRAAGITLILCTQRPSVDVVSGLLRNNLPAIVALKMRDIVNTKIILGDNDFPAHKLLGKGDLVFRAAGEDQRCQSLFVNAEQAINYTKDINTKREKS